MARACARLLWARPAYRGPKFWQSSSRLYTSRAHVANWISESLRSLPFAHQQTSTGPLFAPIAKDVEVSTGGAPYRAVPATGIFDAVAINIDDHSGAIVLDVEQPP